MQTVDSAKTSWWGEWSLKPGEAGHWEIGPLSLWIVRFTHEWRITYREVREPLDEALLVELPLHADQVPAFKHQGYGDTEVSVNRFAVADASGSLVLEATLADRPVVIRPETPLFVPARQSVELYVSTPVWARVLVREDRQTLCEVPTFRPSDTWFGPSTTEGELCYASRTSARLAFEEVPLRFHRAVTPVLVRNEGSDALLVERVQLPVQYLSLFRGENGFLWTEPVTLERHAGEAAHVRIGHGAPQRAMGARLLSEPRRAPESNLITRTFSAFQSFF